MKNNARRLSAGFLNKIKHVAFFVSTVDGLYSLLTLKFYLLFGGGGGGGGLVTDRKYHGDSERKVSSGGTDSGMPKPI